MSNDTTNSTDGTDGLPLQQSRRTLLRLCGSAAAVGGLTGLAAGQETDDGAETEPEAETEIGDERDGAAAEDEPSGNATTPCPGGLHLDGLSVAQSGVTVDSMRVSLGDTGTTEAFAAEKLELTVENDTITGTTVDTVRMADMVSKQVVSLVDQLADGTMPAALDQAPSWCTTHLNAVEDKHYRKLRKGFEKHGGPAPTLEQYLTHGADTNGTGYLKPSFVLVVLILVVVFFVIC